ncbi:ABC transporter permease [Clostridium kluyveri]|uniref:ABC transporter permease n=1 Tax=Clostridium kluyveri TaxID=1534 RepID=UPI0022467862|nr:ABC transporter permease [Clostridium kluyveri]UZQ49474.1 ABC transporter permease [Clostridium kluyveri]
MSFICVLKSELAKYKKSLLWKGVFFIPIFSSILLFIDLHLRYDYLMENSRIRELAQIGIYNKMDVLLYENHLSTLWFILLNLSVVVIAFIVNYMEYSENTWKQIVARPVKRMKIYLSKWIIVFTASVALIALNVVFVILIKKFFGIEGNSALIFKYVLLEIAAVLGVVSFQQFISCYIKNSLVAAAIGFAGTIGSYMLAQSKILGNINPFSCVLRSLPLGDMNDAHAAAIFGAISGILWLIIGILEFNRRDIK